MTQKNEAVTVEPIAAGDQFSGKQLQAIRKILLMSITDAAAMMGRVSSQTWSRWEAGAVPVPADIGDRMAFFFELREKMVENLRESHEGGQSEFPYYASYEEWMEQRKVDSKLAWLLWQSAVGRLSATCPEVKLT